MTKLYVSIRKLDSLPAGARVRFPRSGRHWEKQDNGKWRQRPSSFPFPWDAKTMLGYEANTGFEVLS